MMMCWSETQKVDWLKFKFKLKLESLAAGPNLILARKYVHTRAFYNSSSHIQNPVKVKCFILRWLRSCCFCHVRRVHPWPRRGSDKFKLLLSSAALPSPINARNPLF